MYLFQKTEANSMMFKITRKQININNRHLKVKPINLNTSLKIKAKIPNSKPKITLKNNSILIRDIITNQNTSKNSIKTSTIRIMVIIAKTIKMTIMEKHTPNNMAINSIKIRTMTKIINILGKITTKMINFMMITMMR